MLLRAPNPLLPLMGLAALSCQDSRALTGPAPSTPPAALRAVEGADPELTAALAGVLEGTAVEGAVGAAPGSVGHAPWGLGSAQGGERRPLAATDPVHVGSDTKAMTAVLAARQVDAGHLRWDRPSRRFCPRSRQVHEGYRSATLTQFLRHTSGAPANAPTGVATPTARSGSVASSSPPRP